MKSETNDEETTDCDTEKLVITSQVVRTRVILPKNWNYAIALITNTNSSRLQHSFTEFDKFILFTSHCVNLWYYSTLNHHLRLSGWQQ